MGYHAPSRHRRDARPLGPVEIVCVLVVVAAIVALVVWMIATAGGGALMI